MKEQRKEIPRSIRFPAKLKDRLTKEAAEERRSLQQHVIHILETHVERRAEAKAA